MKYIRDHDRMHVLHLPRWYPNLINPEEGSYIRNYVLASSGYTNTSVLHIFPENEKQHVRYRLDISKEDGIFTVTVYIKKVNIRNRVFANYIKKYRYKKAHQIGLNKITEYSGKPELIHIHGLSMLNSFNFVHKFFEKIPYIISIHNLSYLDKLKKHKAKYKRESYRSFLKNAKEILVHGTEIQHAALRSRLINHVIDISKFEESQNTLGEKLFDIYFRSFNVSPID